MSNRYEALIEASTIWRYEVFFFDGQPVESGGDRKKYGWDNDVKSQGCSTLWGAKWAARRGLRYLDRMDRINERLKEAKWQKAS